MKIGAIGFETQFKHNDIEILTYRCSQTILEYDMLIINANNIFDEYEFVGSYQGIPSITQYDSQKLKEDVRRRQQEFEAFLESGKNIVVITPYKRKVTAYTGKQEVSGNGRNARITNIIEFKDSSIFSPTDFSTTKATGQNIEFVDKKAEEIFKKYIDCFEYYSFTDKEENKHMLAKIRGLDKYVFWYEKINNGIVLFVPDAYFSQFEKSVGSRKEKEFLRDLYTYINSISNDKKVNEIPEWLKNYNTIKENTINQKIQKIEDDIKKLLAKKKKTEEERIKLENDKRIFSASGEELEDIIKNVFIELGFNIVKSGGNEEDLVCEYNNKQFVFEIKGVDGSSSEKHTAQTLKWKTNYFINTGIDGKGVLIVNGFKDKLLEDRNNIFPKQLLKYAEHQQLCLISVTQIFNILSEYREGNLTTKEISDIIWNQNGILGDFENWNLHLVKN